MPSAPVAEGVAGRATLEGQVEAHHLSHALPLPGSQLLGFESNRCMNDGMTARKANRARVCAWRRRPFISRFLAGLGAIIPVILPGSALAGQSARLVYSRTAEAAACGAESGLRQAVARRLGYDPFVASSVNTVVAELRGEGDGLKARVYVIRDGNQAGGARELTSASRNCTELIAAVALAMSIAIDPDSLDRVEQPDDSAAPNDANESARATRKEDAANPTTNDAKPPIDAKRAAVTNKNSPETTNKPAVAGLASKTPGLEGTLGLNGFVASGLAPAPTLGLGLQGGLLFNRHWSVALEPQVTLPSSRTPSWDSSISVRAWSYGATFAFGFQSQGLYGGALFDAGQLSSRGVNVSSSKPDRSWYTATGIRVAYRWQLAQSWALVPRVDGLIALNTLKFLLKGGEVYKTQRLLGRLGLALEYVF